MPLYDYHCSCNHSFEAMKPIADRYTAECPECGADAKMELSAPRISLDGTDPSFPGEYMKWESTRKQKMAQEKKDSAYDPSS